MVVDLKNDMTKSGLFENSYCMVDETGTSGQVRSILEKQHGYLKKLKAEVEKEKDFQDLVRRNSDKTSIFGETNRKIIISGHGKKTYCDRDESEDKYGSDDEVKITDSDLENLLHSDEDSDEEEERRSRCDGSDDRDDDNGFKRKK
ncbi:hypothetical protein ACOSP7_020044 [Xanthoceras sorbifolium]